MSSISNAQDWLTPGPEGDPDTKVFQEGPVFLPEMQHAYIVQAAGGHQDPTFYVGSPGLSHQLWRWTGGDLTWEQIVPAADGSATEARRFFADPYNRDRIYIIDRDGIKRSEDGGRSWQLDASLDQAVTQNGAFSYDLPYALRWVGRVAVINDLVFDREDASLRFAVGPAGVFVTRDGENWARIFSTAATPSYPISAYLDRVTSPSDPTLYVGTNGRSMLRISSIPG